MICRPLLTFSLLQGAATALLDAYVTVNVIQDVSVLNVRALNDLTARAVGEECAVAEAVLNGCVSSGLVSSGVPAASQQACLCCSDGATVAGQYSSCATYLAKESPTETSLLSAIATLYGVCATGGTCAAPTQTQDPPPPECTSVANLWRDCAETSPRLEDASLPDLAKCLCYDARGTFNTEFDAYASTCAPWAQSASPEDFETIASFATLCAAQSPTTSATTTAAPTSAPTVVPVTTTSTGLAVKGVAPGGGVVLGVVNAVLGLLLL